MKLKKKFKIMLIILLALIILFISVFAFYKIQLGGVSDSVADKEVIIEKGSSSKDIAATLKKHNLIKNEYVFLIYVKLHNISDMKFGTYLLQENMGVEKIVDVLINGSKYNPDEVTITIKEGTNMRDIAKVISSVTNNSYDDVINKSNDIEYITELKEKYWFITDSLDNNNLYYKLEGYLYPDTYSLKNKDVSVEYIFNKMLDQMDKVLAPYRDYDYNTMSIHDYLSLASMVEKESSNVSDRVKIASVFLNRMKLGMNLGSDVTARYANKIDDKSKALTASQYQYKSLYNTRLTDGSMNGRLPVGPISTVSKSSIDASFNPDSHNYLYFIANIQTTETFFYENYNDFLAKKYELQSVNGGF